MIHKMLYHSLYYLGITANLVEIKQLNYNKWFFYEKQV